MIRSESSGTRASCRFGYARRTWPTDTCLRCRKWHEGSTDWRSLSRMTHRAKSTKDLRFVRRRPYGINPRSLFGNKTPPKEITFRRRIDRFCTNFPARSEKDPDVRQDPHSTNDSENFSARSGTVTGNGNQTVKERRRLFPRVAGRKDVRLPFARSHRNGLICRGATGVAEITDLQRLNALTRNENLDGDRRKLVERHNLLGAI